jgi:hypothetical protein
MRLPSFCFAVTLCLITAVTGMAQKIQGNLKDDLREFVQTPAIPGYEQQLATRISARLQSYSPKTDEMSNVVVTVGSGSPHRLIVAPMDEPGYVISGITNDGYLRVQRLPQTGVLPLFNELYSAQPVRVGAAGQRWIPGARNPLVSSYFVLIRANSWLELLLFHRCAFGFQAFTAPTPNHPAPDQHQWFRFVTVLRDR